MKKFETAFNKIEELAHGNAVVKGFWEDGDNRNRGELLALVHAEVSEALEGHRKGKHSTNEQIIKAVQIEDDSKFKEFMELNIKDTYENELADVFIRMFDISGGEHINMLAHINAKMRYNEMRGWKHGKKY